MSNWTEGEVIIAAAKLIVEELKSGKQIDMAIFIDAADEVAKAYLSEHPDDDDRPITPEWIDRYRVSDVLYLIEKKDDLCLYVQVNGIYAEIEQYGDSVRIPISTRGDLRRLCKVLKIELKEKHGASA